MTEAQSRAPGRHRPIYSWYVLFVLFLVNAFNAIDRSMITVLVEPIRKEFGFSDGQIGLLAGLGFALFYAVLGIPTARLADRRNRRNILAIGLAAWSAMTVLTGRAGGFLSFLLARAGVGVGEASCYPTAYPLIGDYFPKHRRPLAMALFQMGMFVGVVSGGIIAGKVAAAHGWRAAFGAIGLPGVVLALIVFLTVREPIRGGSEAEPAPRPAAVSFRDAVATLGGNRRFVLAAIGTTCLTIASATLSSWGPAMMMRLHGVSQGDVGPVSAPVGLCGALGTVGGGLIGSYLAKRSTSEVAPLAVPMWISLIGFPAALVFVFAHSLPLSIAGGSIAALCIAVHTGPTLAVAIGLARPDMRGLASAVIVVGHLLLGYGLGPVIAGVLSDALAPTHGVQSLRLALGIAPVLVLFGWIAIRAAYVTREDPA